MKSIKELLLLAVFTILTVIFFYKLNDTPLLSYDEAWYAEITRNIIITKNPFKLIFNNGVFIDHPPFGYILMAIPTIIFGSNEFSVRFMSSLMGMGSVVLIYLLGKKLNNKTSGVIASIVLLSSMWFMFRARSGNLDIPFIFLELLTIYFLLIKEKKGLFLATLSFAAIFLLKTLVGVGIGPVMLFLFLKYHRKYSLITYVKVALIFLVITLPWYVYNQNINSGFLHHHFITIGTRGELNSYSLEAMKLSFEYLAIGIGKWYKVFLSSVGLGVLAFVLDKKQRFNIALLFTWTAGFSLFFISTKTEIWHLLPLFPIVALFISLVPKFTSSILPINIKYLKPTFLIFAVVLGVYQFNQFSNLIYTYQNGYSNEKDISIKAGKYDNISLMETFYPAAIYYSQKNVVALHLKEFSYETMTEKLDNKADEVFIINNDLKSRLEEQKTEFIVLEGNDSYYVISNGY